MARIGISGKFLAAFATLLVAVAAIGGFSLARIGEVNRIAVELRTRWIPASEDIGNIHAYVAQYRIKHAVDGHERVVVESQLAATPRSPF